MKNKNYYGFTFFLVLISIIMRCSNLHDSAPTQPPPELNVHPIGWLNEDSTSFHGKFIQTLSWNLKDCQRCHGLDYAGGIADKSCTQCHINTPEDCVVCHGGKDNQTGAPPKDVDDNTQTDVKGVGAHTTHLTGSAFSDGIECSDCHTVPNAFNETGHADSDLPAEITFSGFASKDNTNPQWDGQSCSDTYCHGSFEPAWTVIDGTQAACGTCHTLPPGGNHPQGEAIEQCVLCHGNVVDEKKNIINMALHINGEVNSTSHPEGWTDSGSPDFHGLFIRASQWDLGACQQCHGTDYSGGLTNISCLTCHPQSPEGCVVCHGGVDNQTGAPPEDLDRNTSNMARGVGAHTVHLSDGTSYLGFDCTICHNVPVAFNEQGHADSELPAELEFSGHAVFDGANPGWDENALTCENTYCHGNWSLPKDSTSWDFAYSGDIMEGNNASPSWTEPGSVVCGSCHDLPPVGHNPSEPNECTNCHSSVLDGNLQFKDNLKHINGKVNVLNMEYPMF